MSRPGPTGKLVTATSMDKIKDLIHSLDCANYNVDILTADTQASYENGVTVLVTGCLTGQDNVRRKFTESFFLAPQDSGYFVLNNTFRFVDEIPVKDSVEEHCNKIAPAAPISLMSAVALLEEMAEIPDDSLGNHTGLVEDIEETTEVPVNQQKSSFMGKVVPQSSTDSSHNVQPDVKASSNGNVDAPKKSYASLLMNGKEGTSVLPDRALAKPVKRNIASKSVRPVEQQIQAATLATVATSTAATEFSAANGNNSNASGNGHASSNGYVAGKGYSIYIGHLPYDATPKLVEQEFKKFGCIKKNGIQVRSNKGYVFGFVEYEDASARENALKVLKWGQSKLVIESFRLRRKKQMLELMIIPRDVVAIAIMVTDGATIPMAVAMQETIMGSAV
ncbi:nuclear transport factor 2-like [Silene latifolia]|uniref:nuclear transport factor 2-like n=1 Tax=Silene latifolia TaxID=37657 RepID=UPI003D770891